MLKDFGLGKLLSPERRRAYRSRPRPAEAWDDGSAGRAGWPTSRAARNAIVRYGVKTKMHSRRRSSGLRQSIRSLWRVSRGSRRCSSEPAGRWAKTGVERIWRREGLKVPQEAEATPVERLWLQRWFMRAAPADTSQPCVELRLRQRADA